MLEILEAGGPLTLQDSGRRGWQKFGVPLSGPMDWFAHRAANLLAGNSHECAALEIGFSDVTLRAQRDCVLALTGAGFAVSTYVWEFPLWNSFYVRAGWTVNILKQGEGSWAYLTVAGGFDSDVMLGSRSANVRAGLGRNLGAGDVLNLGTPTRSLEELSARTLPAEKRPGYGLDSAIAVIPGPQADWFGREGTDTFFAGDYLVSEASDRMGYRLRGNPIPRRDEAELLSEGIVMGSVQIPADGQPIVMMSDCGTTGGYPQIANIIKADLPRMAQAMPGKSVMRFSATTVEQAQSRYRSLLQNLEGGIVGVDNDAALAQ